MRRSQTLLITALLLAFPRTGTILAFSGHPALAIEQGVGSEPLVIVVNRSNPLDDLSSAELRKIFLGNRSHWANGRRITLVMREPGEPERTALIRDVCGMT